MKKKVKWCIIGAGGIADRRTIPALLTDETNEIVAVMDRVYDVAKAVKEKYGFQNFYTDVDEMLKSTPCDAVYIGTPVFCHFDQAMTALKYGVNVFTEKPIAINGRQAEELLKAFKAKGKQLTVGYMMPYHNLHQKMKKIIKDGGIGQVVNVRAQFSCWYPEIQNAWRQKKSLGGGGALMDLGVHCFDLIENVTGQKIVDAKAFLGRNTFSYEVEDSAVVLLKLDKGTLCHVDVNFNIPDDCSTSKFEIYGTEGYLQAEGTLGQEETGKLKYLYAPQGNYDASQVRVVRKPKTFKATGRNIYLKQVQVFNACVLSGKPDYTTAENAVGVQKTVDKIYASTELK